MRLIADLHIHSRFSRATGKKLTPPYLDRWARIKGIDLLGTGDCTHPLWLKELRDQLEEQEPGLYQLKPSLRREFDRDTALAEGLPKPSRETTRFVLTGEISAIYKRDGRTRKVHHLIILPDFKAAGALQNRLERIGTIDADGRPIFGVDSRDLLAILLEADNRAVLIPAHIWTPWFSVLGAKSGFDSLEECFGDGCRWIPAIETGLSSNPPMNWALPALDSYGIISNSDAHSPEKIGREATVFSMDPCYQSLWNALWSVRRGGADGILETIEFFPQEGKYHYEGHRKCAVCRSPEETARSGSLCPVCGKPLTQGVMGRALQLAGRPVDETAPCPRPFAGTNRRPYRSLIPLRELLGELLETSAASKKAAYSYDKLIEAAGSEFALLAELPLEQIRRLDGAGVSGGLLAAAIDRMRSGLVSILPGYDGEYGVVRAYPQGTKPAEAENGALFDLAARAGEGPASQRGPSPPSGSQEAARDLPCLAVQPGPPSGSQEAARDLSRLAVQPGPPSGSQEAARDLSCLAVQPGPLSGSQEAARDLPCLAVQPGPPSGSQEAARDLSRLAVQPGPLSGSQEAEASRQTDPAQEAAIHYAGRQASIIAGPGTGKTRVLSARIFQLLAEGREAASILALTFTVKAAAELRERIARGPQGGAGVIAATFHSFCCSLLREYPAALPDGFQVLGETGRAGILEELCAREKRSSSAQRLGKYLEERKRFLLRPGEGPGELPGFFAQTFQREAAAGDFWASFPAGPADPALEALYCRYQEGLRSANLADYDDLPLEAVRLLGKNREVLAAVRRRFRHIFVDEYQDSNFAQYLLIRLLAPAVPDGEAEPPELRVIGDPNQAVYGFRGSDKRFLDRFFLDYPEAKRLYLGRSFRCAAPLIAAANRLMGADLQGRPGTVELRRASYPTEKSEAEGIARCISRLIGGTGFFALDSGVASGLDSGNASGPAESSGLEDMAVLLRTLALAPPIIKALRDHGIPYTFSGDQPWWEKEPAQTLIAAVRANAASRACAPPGPREAVLAAWETLRRSGAVSPKAEGPPDRLLHLADLYADLDTFADTLALCGPARQAGDDPLGPLIQAQGVRIMTIHASKGLEFDQVFIPALEEGLLPFTLFEGDGDDGRIEEEQRLFYVAMTRARRGLFLSWAKSRTLDRRKVCGGPSRFLAKLEDLIPLEAERPSAPQDPQLTLF